MSWGAALKPFPESIQVSELGTLVEPDAGEIGEARENKRASWPVQRGVSIAFGDR